MKLLLLLFITISAHAQIKATIDLTSGGQRMIQKDTQAELDEALLKFLAHPYWSKQVTWNETLTGAIPKDEAGNPLTRTDTMEGKTLYAHSDALTVTVKDITAELDAEKKEKEDRETKIQSLVNKLNTPATLTDDEVSDLLRLLRQEGKL